MTILVTLCVLELKILHLSIIQVLCNAFFQGILPPPTPRNAANNVEPYTFVTLFSGKADTPHPTPHGIT